MKSTYGEINGQGYEIYKKPKTDTGIKNSAKGLLRVNSDLSLSEGVTESEEREGMLKTVFNNGKLTQETTLNEIRQKLAIV